jgi:hypothetical protein
MYLYHMYYRGDGSLRDDTLYTLNQLKEKHPDLHALHVQKYETRPEVPKQHFPHIDCDWGGAVFLCPVHPEKICAALAQYRKREVPPFPYHEIPVADLDPSNLALWLFKTREYTPIEVIPFEQRLLEEMREVPEATKGYFDEQRQKHEPALFFVHVPHVLHKGSIDMSRYNVQYTREYKTGK